MFFQIFYIIPDGHKISFSYYFWLTKRIWKLHWMRTKIFFKALPNTFLWDKIFIIIIYFFPSYKANFFSKVCVLFTLYCYVYSFFKSIGGLLRGIGGEGVWAIESLRKWRKIDEVDVMWRKVGGEEVYGGWSISWVKLSSDVVVGRRYVVNLSTSVMVWVMLISKIIGLGHKIMAHFQPCARNEGIPNLGLDFGRISGMFWENWAK